MAVLAVLVGVVLVVAVLLDMINTLVTTHTSSWRWWLSAVLTRFDWWLIRSIAVRLREGRLQTALLASFAPVLVLHLLVVWVAQQIIGFGLIWWGIGGIQGTTGLVDNIYYSGIVFFTVGFGEVVPADVVPRFGALLEAFSGVLTTALVIGYLPALYGAYSERERKLMTLDDGTEDRITPTELVLAWAPDASVDDLVGRFAAWEEWVAGIIETHSTFPMLRFFRSHHEGQNWITALGLVSDAALHCELIQGAAGRAPYWFVRRSTRLFQELTDGVDLSAYREQMDQFYIDDGGLFRDLYDRLEAHGFEMLPFDEAFARNRGLRKLYDAPMEYLIDETLAPRGFWGHTIGSRR